MGVTVSFRLPYTVTQNWSCNLKYRLTHNSRRLPSDTVSPHLLPWRKIVPHLFAHPTEPGGHHQCSEPRRRIVALLDAAMILLDGVTQTRNDAMRHALPQRLLNRPWIGCAPIRSDLLRLPSHYRAGRRERSDGFWQRAESVE